jgi:hypothetical protein
VIWLSDEELRVFLALTVIIGGGAAFLAGRGLARSWKPFWRVFFYMALLAGAVRFFLPTTISSPMRSCWPRGFSASASCGRRKWSRNIVGFTSGRAR